jgi:hypothetical protein
LGALGVATVALTGVIWLFDDAFDRGTTADTFLPAMAVTFGVVLAMLVAFGLPLLGFWRGSWPWHRVYVVTGLAMLASVAVTVMASDESDPGFFVDQGVEKLSFPATGYFLLTASAALAVSRPVLARLRSTSPVGRWVETASNTLVLFSIASVAVAVGLTFTLIHRARTDAALGSTIAQVLILVLAVTVALVARALLLSHASRHRVRVLALAGALVLLLMLAAIVAYQRDDDRMVALELLWFVWPALVGFALTVPAPVRAALGPITAGPPDRAADTWAEASPAGATGEDAPTRYLEPPEDGRPGSV